MFVENSKLFPPYFLDKSIPINGLSPVPRDQCAGSNGNNTGLEMHPMYSSFRAAVVAAAPNASSHGPPPPPHSGKPKFIYELCSSSSLSLQATFPGNGVCIFTTFELSVESWDSRIDMRLSADIIIWRRVIHCAVCFLALTAPNSLYRSPAMRCL